MARSFTEEFGLKYPMVLAPMFLINRVPLVVAAAKAGILGTFPALNYRSTEEYRAAIRSIKTETGHGNFGINIIVQQSNRLREEQMNIAMEEGVRLIISSLGNPAWFIEKAHETGAKVYCDVVGEEHARKAIDLGADGLIAVAYGAGGHAGTLSPFALIPRLRSLTDRPILAAGAIGTGRTMAAAKMLGADGVFMGTRFIASEEAQVEPVYKQAVLDAVAEDIVNTDKVDGFPGNFILNPDLYKFGLKPGFLEYLLSYNKRLKRLYSLSRAARALLGRKKPKLSYRTVWSAGQGVAQIDSVRPIRDIVEQIMNEYEECMHGIASASDRQS